LHQKVEVIGSKCIALAEAKDKNVRVLIKFGIIECAGKFWFCLTPYYKVSLTSEPTPK